jgi:hypothetical protein
VSASNGAAQVSVSVAALSASAKAAGYVRMMVWLENLPGGANPGHWSIMGMSGLAFDANVGRFPAGVSFGGASDVNSRFIYLGSGADCTRSIGPSMLPLKKWVCVEMKADATETLDYGLKLDGKPISWLTFADTTGGDNCYTRGNLNNVWYVPDPRHITYGWYYWHTQGRPIRMWIDDVVADENPIGCPPQQ